MPARNSDLHGFAPDTSPVALLLIDFINPLDFPEGDQLLPFALEAARRAAHLKAGAKAAGVPVVYANDNFGRWRSDLSAVVDRCLESDCPGRELAALLKPDADDYFVLKPKHSAFFSTTLDTLLGYLGAKTLVMAGVAGNICVLFSANDAYMRDFQIVVAADATASNADADNRAALHQMRQVLKADVRPAAEIDWATLKESPAREKPSRPAKG